jgi:hypothetical protein
MTAFRKSGPCVAYTWSGDMPEPDQPTFFDGLSARRFRTIENAASEETSFGWVTPDDPSGGSFSFEDLDGGPGTWLRLRFDTKKLPAEQVRMHLAAAKRAKGRSLTSRERRELKDDIAEKLLPRILPTTRNVDVLLFHAARVLLVFSSSKAARDGVAESLRGSFGELHQVRLTAGTHAIAVMGTDVVRKLKPTRFPGGGPRQLVIESDADFLGEEFLTWLWWRCEVKGGAFAHGEDEAVAVAFDGMLQFAAPDDEVETTLRHGLPAKSDEARAALRQGRLLSKAQVQVARGNAQWTVTITGASMTFSARLPEDPDDCESDLDRTHDRAANWLAIHQILTGMFRLFLLSRNGSGWRDESQAMAQWMAS